MLKRVKLGWPGASDSREVVHLLEHNQSAPLQEQQSCASQSIEGVSI